MKVYHNSCYTFHKQREDRMKALVKLVLIFVIVSATFAQNPAGHEVPAVYSNIRYDKDGRLYVEHDGLKIYEQEQPAPLILERMKGNPIGTEVGLAFDFGEGLEGTLYYGFIDYGDSRHPMPVYFYSPATITNGKTHIDIKNRMRGNFDMIGWQASGRGTLGYRVADNFGNLLYDGVISFKGTGPFEIDTTVTQGHLVHLLGPEGVTISFETNFDVIGSVGVGERVFADATTRRKHEITVSGLRPDTQYDYEIRYGDKTQTYAFRTAPERGSRKPFTFSYCSDSRSGTGGGERNLYGTNFYIMKKIMALSMQKKARFMQFTGDLVTGYLRNVWEMHLHYANWKRAVEPFAHYFPVVAAMGNHEVMVRRFVHPATGSRVRVDRFPFATESAEQIFAENFVNPLNGPETEDGAVYDPDPESVNFPSYRENVFHYTYDNVAMITLNSDYFYAPSTKFIPVTSGNPHGYIMDNQLRWLAETVAKFEKDDRMDHVFVTVHTPFFPNGGHVANDMWYRGSNDVRAYVAGQPLAKGIIERRDELLDILVNKSTKVVAILTGDEHNYNRLKLSAETEIYPEGYDKKKIKLSRTIYQINNGAAGAPYYAQEQTPWTQHVSGFTTQNAVVFFHVDGKKISVEVLNPDTLEEVDRFELR